MFALFGALGECTLTRLAQAVTTQAIASSTLALCITYVVHGLLWAGVGALSAAHPKLPVPVRNRIWKAALLGPFVTVLLASTPLQALARAPLAKFALPNFTLTLSAIPPGSALSGSSAGAGSAGDAVAGITGSLSLTAVGLATMLGLLRFGAAAHVARSMLSRRRPVRDARIAARFKAMCVRMGASNLLLTESTRLLCPMVVGRREICIPEGLLAGLPDAQIDAVFGHELAHIERRDGIWFPIAG
ncbi:MAG TPA: M48 family metalloprotease, partial [Polyangiaceae bacterium]|nr:M48 family metalloprotease [Polyangiaceae bacterium]